MGRLYGKGERTMKIVSMTLAVLMTVLIAVSAPTQSQAETRDRGRQDGKSARVAPQRDIRQAPPSRPSSPPALVQKSGPYGGVRRDSYGARRQVRNPEAARRSLNEFYGRNNMRVGEIREREHYYQAEIRDGRGNIVDRVIIDKRTGRIRSIY
jgi:hypothetical protein